MRKKMKNYVEIFGNIMQKKVTIMRRLCGDYAEISKSLICFLGFSKCIKYSLTCYWEFNSFMFNLLLPFVDSYFFIQRILSEA